MFVGLDGTVGGSVLDAAGKVIRERADRVWNALNEPIPFSKFAALKPGADALDKASAGARAIGAQIAKLRSGATAGSIPDEEYRQAAVENQLRTMADFGFIGQLCHAYGRRNAGRAFYFRGPTTLGLQDPEIVDTAVAKVRSHHRKGEPLIVAGYSRGGLNAINVCDRIVSHGGSVDLLILFDPVARDAALGACNISAGVANCVLVQRGGNWITWRPYKRQVKVAGYEVDVPDIWLTNSRWYFGRMVDSSDHDLLTKGRLETAEIDCTHAAMGGVPWTGDNPSYMSQASDRLHAGEVARFVNRSVHSISGWDPALRLTLPMQ